MIILAELSEVFKDFPIINFDTKKQHLLNIVSKRYPNNTKLHEMVRKFQKSKTVVSPYEFPLSDDFIDTINSTFDEQDIEILIQRRLDDQYEELKKDYDYRINAVSSQYNNFVRIWEVYENDLKLISKQIGDEIKTEAINQLITKLKDELDLIE